MSKGKRLREEHRRESQAKRHHMVPEFYLRRFADEHGRLAAIRRGTGAMHVASTEKLCVQAGFYTYIDTEGAASTELEDFLATFEGQAAPVFERIVAQATGAPSEDDRALLLNFIAFQVGRGRYFRHQYNALTDFMHKVMLAEETRDRDAIRARWIERLGEEPTAEDIDGWLHMLDNPDDYVFEPHANESIMAGLHLGAELVDMLAARPWIVLRMEQPVLFTSDEPVVTWSRPRPEDAFVGRGFLNADEIRLSLDPQHMLVLPAEHPSARSGAVPLPYARSMNQWATAWAHEWVYVHPQHPELGAIQEWAREMPLRQIQANAFGEEKTIPPRASVARNVAGPG